jgi:hypothetical protein
MAGEVYINGEYVGVATDIDIESLNTDDDRLRDYIRRHIRVISIGCGGLIYKVEISKERSAKLLGIWSWAERNCPNGRLVYLMRHGKNKRIRYKNYRRAVTEIGKYIKEVKND